jgi:hypothetical protein
MRTFLTDARFLILRELVAFGNEGVLHNFGRLAGRWNEERNDEDLTILGRLLRKIIPVSASGHMLCYVVQNQPMPVKANFKLLCSASFLL